MSLSTRHLLGLNGVPKEDLQLILDTARTFREVLERPIKKVPTLQGKTIVNLFYEDSTRTRISFELAQMIDVIKENEKYTCREFINNLYQRLVKFRGTDSFEDDICLVCLDIK